jgi:hypothetical protein
MKLEDGTVYNFGSLFCSPRDYADTMATLLAQFRAYKEEQSRKYGPT